MARLILLAGASALIVGCTRVQFQDGSLSASVDQPSAAFQAAAPVASGTANPRSAPPSPNATVSNRPPAPSSGTVAAPPSSGTLASGTLPQVAAGTVPARAPAAVPPPVASGTSVAPGTISPLFAQPAPIVVRSVRQAATGYPLNEVVYPSPDSSSFHFITAYQPAAPSRTNPGAARIAVSAGTGDVYLWINNYEPIVWTIDDPSGRVKGIVSSAYYASRVILNGLDAQSPDQRARVSLVYGFLAQAGGSAGASDEFYAPGMKVSYRPAFSFSAFAGQVSAYQGRRLTHFHGSYVAVDPFRVD